MHPGQRPGLSGETEQAYQSQQLPTFSGPLCNSDAGLSHFTFRRYFPFRRLRG